MTETITIVKRLPRKILRMIENEFEEFKRGNPEIKESVDSMFKRLRGNILDELGDCQRTIEELNEG